MPGPKIAITGAGPAGLTLARLLQVNGIQCTIYEGETDRHARNQGGTLDLHPKAGQRALKEAGLFEKFRNHARPEGESLKLLNGSGDIIFDEGESDDSRPQEYADRPEIDRNKLRDILLDSIEPGTIKWGHRIASVEADSKNHGRHIITFLDGSKETDIELLVGADGAWSKVRPILSNQQPYYSGVTAVELWALNASETKPWLSQHVGAGSNFMMDEGRAVLCQQQGNDSIRVYACVQKPENWKDQCGIDWSEGDAVRQTLVTDLFKECAEDVKRSILEARDECIVRQLYMLPIGFEWERRPGVTLIGDAGHLMTPFAGVGVNLAMTDAMSLAHELIAGKDSFLAKAFSDSHNIEMALKAYEKEMFPRSRQYAQKTADSMVERFKKDGAISMVKRMGGA